MQDVVRKSEHEIAEKMGTTTIEDWMGKVLTGDKGV